LSRLVRRPFNGSRQPGVGSLTLWHEKAAGGRVPRGFMEIVKLVVVPF